MGLYSKENKKVLIIEDKCRIKTDLSYFLENKYEVEEPKSSLLVMAYIYKNYRFLSGIIIDVNSKTTNCMEILRRLRENPFLLRIPVIVIDFIGDKKKPSRLQDDSITETFVVPFEWDDVKRTINEEFINDAMGSIPTVLRHDFLTSLYNRDTYFLKVSEIVSVSKPNTYIISCFDIDNFKLINGQYGPEEGDRILREVAEKLKKIINKIEGFCARISDDNFSLLYRNDPEVIKYINEHHDMNFFMENVQDEMRISEGRYIISDITIPASVMYDRAFIAKQSVKGLFDKRIAYFDDNMLKTLLFHQTVASEMDKALEKKEFEIWLQPQINHATHSIIGSEALLRWKHPQRGLINPNDFIPQFEQNGFIYEVDKFVWEESCKLLRRWIDEGKNPVPISVNISRYDIYKEDIVTCICGLLKKYDLLTDYLRLEITESAFSKSSHQIIDVVKQLMAFGFKVEIDDFGSGYSSLNTLKDVPADILKLDMRFMENTEDSKRAGNIIESVCRMAKWLGMAVIAEGVESIEQADFLLTIDCDYVQGFLYSKPLPIDEFEKFTLNFPMEHRLTRLTTVVNLDNNSFWDPKSMDTLIFNSYVGGACIFEYHDGRIELLRSNEKYSNQFANYFFNKQQITEVSPTHFLNDANKKIMYDAINKAIQNGNEVMCETRLDNLDNNSPFTTLFIQSTLKVIAKTTNRYLFYCTVNNVSEQRNAELKEKIISNHLKAIMDNTKVGITAVTLDDFGNFKYIFVNDRYYELLGYTREQFHSEIKSAFDTIVKEDYKTTNDAIKLLKEDGKILSLVMRAKKRDGKLVWLRSDITLIRLEGEERPVQLANFIDISEEAQAKEEEHRLYEQLQLIMRNMSAGVTACIMAEDGPQFILANDKYYEQLGYTKQQFDKEVVDKFSLVVSEDREKVRESFYKYSKLNEPFALNYRIERKDGTIRYIQANIDTVNLIGIKQVVQLAVYNDVTSLRKAEEKEKSTSNKLTTVLNKIGDGITCVIMKKFSTDLIMANDRYFEILGYTREEYEAVTRNDPISLVYSADRAYVDKAVHNTCVNDKETIIEFRVKQKDDSIKWVRAIVTVTMLDGFDYPVQIGVFSDITKQKKNEQELFIREQEYRIAAEHAGRTIGRYDIGKQSLTISFEAATRLSLPEVMENVPYGMVEQERISADTQDAYISFYEDILSGKKNGDALFEKLLNNEFRWINADSTTIYDKDGKAVSAIITFVDVTDQNEKEEIYNKWMQSIKSRNPIDFSFFRCDLQKGTLFESSYGTLITNTEQETSADFTNKKNGYAEHMVHKEDREYFFKKLELSSLIKNYNEKKRSFVIEYREIMKTGSFRWIKLSVDLVERPDKKGIIAYLLFENINESKLAENEIIHRAESDSLTGLLNRRVFVNNMEESLKQSHSHLLSALFILDLDYFKDVNDTLGHIKGDEALLFVAKELQSIVRPQDMLGRLGGDEFLVFINGIEDIESISRMAKTICDGMHLDLGRNMKISTSLGIALYPQNGITFQDLYHAADRALYKVKGQGKNNFGYLD